MNTETAGTGSAAEMYGNDDQPAHATDPCREPTPVTEQPKKWVAGDAGPRMIKQVNEALQEITRQHSVMKELSGVKGQKEGLHAEREYCFWQLFSGIRRPDVAAAWLRIGEKYGWTVTKANYKDILATVQTELVELAKNMPVVDKRVTPEERAEKDAEMKKYEQEREEKARVRALENEAKAKEWNAKYPYLDRKGVSKLSPWALAAENIRRELAREFPCHMFRVTSESYTGGSSIDVEWNAGPTVKEIKKITEKYETASFDGMTDCENSIATYWNAVFGGVKYISEKRNIDDATRKAIADMSGYAEGTWEKFEGEHYQHLRETIENQSFYVVRPDPAAVPQQQAGETTPTTGGNGITVSQNEQHDGVELRFADKPSEEMRSKMKAHGFRITRRPPWVWYHRRTPAALEFAYGLAGVSLPKAGPTNEDYPCTDMGYEDRCAAACGM